MMLKRIIIGEVILANRLDALRTLLLYMRQQNNYTIVWKNKHDINNNNHILLLL